MTPAQLFSLVKYIATASMGCRVIITSCIPDDCDGNVSFNTKSVGRPVIRIRKKRIINQNVGEIGETDWLLMATVLMHELGHVDQHRKCSKYIVEAGGKKKGAKSSKLAIHRLDPYLYHLFGLIPNDKIRGGKKVGSLDWRLKMVEKSEVGASRYAFRELSRLLIEVTDNHELMYEIFDRMQTYYDCDQLLSELDPSAIKEWLRDAWIESYGIKGDKTD